MASGISHTAFSSRDAEVMLGKEQVKKPTLFCSTKFRPLGDSSEGTKKALLHFGLRSTLAGGLTPGPADLPLYCIIAPY